VNNAPRADRALRKLVDGLILRSNTPLLTHPQWVRRLHVTSVAPTDARVAGLTGGHGRRLSPLDITCW
jgi:hypothetical protein